jgi:hypothetical protein
MMLGVPQIACLGPSVSVTTVESFPDLLDHDFIIYMSSPCCLRTSIP